MVVWGDDNIILPVTMCSLFSLFSIDYRIEKDQHRRLAFQRGTGICKGLHDEVGH